jgi:Holliday junction resolvase
MGYLILTTVEKERFYLFKKEQEKLAVFTDDETTKAVNILKTRNDVFTVLDTLHRSNSEIRRIDLNKAIDKGKTNLPDAIDDVASQLGVIIVGIERSEVVQYNYV